MVLAAMCTRADLYVDASADSASADGSESHPYATIQDAINSPDAPAGTTIRIAAGVYSQGGDEVEGSTSSRVKINGKALHLIGAGRGKTIIVGNPGSGANRSGACRCIFVNYGQGTVIEGVTLKGGTTVSPDRTAYDSRSGGGILVAGGQGSDPLSVYLVDSEIVGCTAVYGGGAKRGTLVRCLVDGCNAESGLAAHDARLVNCVATRSQRAGYVSEDGVAASSYVYNCTFVDNNARYAIVNGYETKGSVLVRSSVTSVAYGTDDVAGCVSGSTASHGDYQLIAPAFDDWRPIAGFDADGAADFAVLENLSLPEGLSATNDFTGAAIVATGGRINAGAIQATAVAAAGGLLFEPGNVAVPLVIDGKTNSFANGTWVMPEAYPTQYVVSAAAGDNAICRLARRSGGGSDNHISQLGFAPRLDDTLVLLPPPSADEVATNLFEFADIANVKWTDPVNGSDSNPGTCELPYKTLKAAAESIPSDFGETGGIYVIYAKKGVYDEGTMTCEYLNNVGAFRLVVKAGNFGRIRIVAVDGPEETFIVGAPNTPGLAGTLDGCGDNAVRGVHITGRCDVSLQGFTITGCYSLASQYDTRKNGAAVYAYYNGDEAKSAQITDCIISNNFGLASIVCGGRLKRCRIEGNTAKETVFNGREGGSTSFDAKSAAAAFCVFANNTLTEPGDAQGVIGGAARVYNCTVVGTPRTGRLAGGRSAYSLNTVYDGGATVYGASSLTNCVVYNYQDATGVSTAVNRLEKPMFVSRKNGDYRVDRSSPCVGFAAALDADPYFWGVFDGAMDGALRFKDGFAVVGAYQETPRTFNNGLCVIVK